MAKNSKITVCVPSKGRPNTLIHKKFFNTDKFEVYFFVEPADYDKYDVENKVNIEATDRGVSFVRNYILDWAQKKRT